VIKDIAWLKARHPWPGLKTVIIVDSTREVGARTEHKTRLCIASLELDAETLGPIIRAHWAIENSLHWVMDMVFRDDETRLRSEHAPANFTTIRHMAHNLIQKAPGKDSFHLRRKVTAWDDEFLTSLLTA
jgi:predicted transposase YbfD/YdcC